MFLFYRMEACPCSFLSSGFRSKLVAVTGRKRCGLFGSRQMRAVANTENRLLFKNPLALLVNNLAAFDMNHGDGIIEIGKTVGTDEAVALGLAIDGF